MDIEKFGHSPIGKLVAISGIDGLDRQFDHFAYLPKPLPPAIDLTGATWNIVAAAAAAIGRLDGEGRRLPNPNNLARQAIRAEAVSSSALEGTYTTLSQVLQSELFEDETSSDVNEVRDYVRAAEMGFTEVGEGRPLGVNLIRRLHKELMRSDRTCPANEKGQVRTRQNFIGPRPDSPIEESYFVPPPAGEALLTGVHDWESWIHNKEINLVVRMAVGHYQFETLHPFIDGNGRLGRLVAILLLLHDGELSVPLLNVSPYLERRRDDYQNHLRAVSMTGDFDPWVRFFCEGVRRQAESAVQMIETLLDIKQEIMDDLHARRMRGITVRIVDDLIGYPLMTPPLIAERYGVSWQAATNALNALARIGHLRQLRYRGNRRLYACDRILDVVRAVGEPRR